jgi:chromosome partitioning protein
MDKYSTKVIAVVNHKGGVGKTTVSVNLSAALGRLGHIVLVIDMDPQANASLTLGKVHPHEVNSNTVTLLTSETVDHVAPWQDTVETNVRLIAGHISLTETELDLPRLSLIPSCVLRNRLPLLALEEIDFIVIDCPPGLGILTQNALAAADYYLVPMESGSKYSLHGLAGLEKQIRRIQTELNPNLKLMGTVITKHDGRKNVCKAMRPAIEARFSSVQPFRTVISGTTKYKESESNNRTIFQRDRGGMPAREFYNLGKEILERFGLKPRQAEAEYELEGVA